MSTRYKEYCSTAPEYTAEEAGELVVSMLEVERQMASPTPYDNQDEIALQQDYDHLKLDYAIALAAYNSFDPDDPLVVTHGHALQEADETLATFEAAYPEAVLASANLYGEVPPASEPASTVDTATSPVETGTPTQAVISEPLPVTESPSIPTVNPSSHTPRVSPSWIPPRLKLGKRRLTLLGPLLKPDHLKPASGLGRNIQSNPD